MFVPGVWNIELNIDFECPREIGTLNSECPMKGWNIELHRL
jgi:hypothetical protein